MMRNYLPALKRRSQDTLHGAMRPFSIADMMEDFWKAPFDFSTRDLGFPAVDVSENEKAVEVRAELPGMDPKDIDVSLEKGILTIKGEKKFEDEEKKDEYHRIERSYGSFSRSLALPVAVDGDKVKAEYKDGVLRLTLPKAASATPRRIEIK